MIRLECDYAEGAHPRVLRRLTDTNFDQTVGYGEDTFCDKARAQVRALCGGGEDLSVHFLVGGTQVNTTVIAAALRPHQGVIAAHTGHINVHETGAIESTGHKVLPIPSEDGKLTAAAILALWRAHWTDATHEHMVQPAMVYLSQPTENGTLYSLEELDAIWQVCQSKGLILYIDGARLGYGLMSKACDMTLPDLAIRCDAFTIGGTKQGLLFGEALVIRNRALNRDFRYLIKQRGGLLAKGRLLGLQFDVLFTDGLYFELGRHAVELAQVLKEGFAAKDYPFMCDSSTNQQFPILSLEQAERLGKDFSFDDYGPADETHRNVRFCTSWATTREQVETLLSKI